MTTADLSLFAKVDYNGLTAIIVKVKGDGALLYSAETGWFSYVIPASELSLISKAMIPTGTPSSIETATLFSKVYVNGKQGYLIDKRIVPNEFTGQNYAVGLVYFLDTETSDWYDDTQVEFSVGDGEIPDGEQPPGNTNLGSLVKWGAILAVGYFLLKGNGNQGSSYEAD